MATAKKINLAIIFGGRSAEHDVSVVSARNIARAADKKKYDITLVGIDRDGDWFYFELGELLEEKPLFEKENKIGVIPFSKSKEFFLKMGAEDRKIDAVFPVLHGPFGEDGTIQGLFKIMNVPFVGPSVLGSALGMDKDAAKRIFSEAGLPAAKFLTVRSEEKNAISFQKAKRVLGMPFFVKPANLGSSIGISKVKNEKEFKKAVKKAFSYDRRILLEKFIEGKEIECSVLGNENPIASVPGEIIPNHEFYSYEAKYLDENGAAMAIPAEIPKSVAKKVQKMAIEAFKALGCEGMGRVDFFLTPKNEIFINEINTIPGFTSISMYPKLWEESGISCSRLIDKLVKLAIDRHKTEERLKVVR